MRTDAPAELYFARGANRNRCLLFTRMPHWNGWHMEWSNGPGSVLIPLSQLDRVPLPPDFDIVAAIRERAPVPAPGKDGAP